MSLTGLAFAAVFLAGLGLAFVRHPLFGLYTYIAVFYLHPPSRWWGESLPDLRWSLVAAAVTIIVAFRYKSEIERPSWISTTPAKLLLAYTIWLWIQTPWALNPVKHYECAVMFSKYLLVFFSVYRLVDTPEKARWFFIVNLLGCLYLGWLARAAGTVDGRVDGVGGPGIDDSNTLSMHVATVIIAGAAVLLKEKRHWFAICAIALAFALNTLIAASSRGAFLALAFGGLLLAYLHPKRLRRKFMGFAVLGILAFGILVSQLFWERLSTLNAVVAEDQQLESSAQSRVVLAKAQLEMAKAYPLGNGHRGTEVLSPQYLDAIWLTEAGGRSSHNTFLTALVEQGIPGAVMYFCYFFWGARCIARMKALTNTREYEDAGLYGSAALCGLLVVFVAGQFADFLKVEVQIWLCAVVVSMLAFGQKALVSSNAAATVMSRGRSLPA